MPIPFHQPAPPLLSQAFTSRGRSGPLTLASSPIGQGLLGHTHNHVRLSVDGHSLAFAVLEF